MNTEENPGQKQKHEDEDFLMSYGESNWSQTELLQQIRTHSMIRQREIFLMECSDVKCHFSALLTSATYIEIGLSSPWLKDLGHRQCSFIS